MKTPNLSTLATIANSAAFAISILDTNKTGLDDGAATWLNRAAQAINAYKNGNFGVVRNIVRAGIEALQSIDADLEAEEQETKQNKK